MDLFLASISSGLCPSSRSTASFVVCFCTPKSCLQKDTARLCLCKTDFLVSDLSDLTFKAIRTDAVEVIEKIIASRSKLTRVGDALVGVSLTQITLITWTKNCSYLFIVWRCLEISNPPSAFCLGNFRLRSKGMAVDQSNVFLGEATTLRLQPMAIDTHVKPSHSRLRWTLR